MREGDAEKEGEEEEGDGVRICWLEGSAWHLHAYIKVERERD